MIPVMDTNHDTPGFHRLIAIVTRDGALDPSFPIQCEPHASTSNDPGCKWPEPARRTWWQTRGDNLRGWRDWLLEVLSDGD